MVHAVTVCTYTMGQSHCTEGLSVPGMPEMTVKSSMQIIGHKYACGTRSKVLSSLDPCDTK